MRLLLGIFLLLAIASNGNAQAKKETTFRYTHKQTALLAPSKEKYVYIINRSPYSQNNNSKLCPKGYIEDKGRSQYLIEFRTGEITPVMNNDGTVKMSKMLMFYTYTVTVRVYDENGTLLSEKELTPGASLNTIYIDKSVDVMLVHMGDRFTIASYIDKNKEAIYAASVTDAQDYLNYAFNGKRNVDTFAVYSARATKQNYSYKEMDYAVSTFKSVMQNRNTAKEDTGKANKSIRYCIKIWESELSQANYKNNGARINKDVAMGLHYNLSLAYFALADYDKAYYYIQGTYVKEIDHQQQLRPFTPFEKRAIALERNILMFYDKSRATLIADSE